MVSNYKRLKISNLQDLTGSERQWSAKHDPVERDIDTLVEEGRHHYVRLDEITARRASVLVDRAALLDQLKACDERLVALEHEEAEVKRAIVELFTPAPSSAPDEDEEAKGEQLIAFVRANPRCGYGPMAEAVYGRDDRANRNKVRSLVHHLVNKRKALRRVGEGLVEVVDDLPTLAPLPPLNLLEDVA